MLFHSSAQTACLGSIHQEKWYWTSFLFFWYLNLFFFFWYLNLFFFLNSETCRSAPVHLGRRKQFRGEQETSVRMGCGCSCCGQCSSLTLTCWCFINLIFDFAFFFLLFSFFLLFFTFSFHTWFHCEPSLSKTDFFILSSIPPPGGVCWVGLSERNSVFCPKGFKLEGRG